MSVSQVPLRPVAKGTLVKLWLAVALLAALAYGVAAMGALSALIVGPCVGEILRFL